MNTKRALRMKENKNRKKWKGILCILFIVIMLCSSTMAFAENLEMTTQCINTNSFLSDPWGTVGDAISNGFSNGVNALRFGDLYRRYGNFTVTLQMGKGAEVIGPSTIVSWIRVGENGNEYYDDNKLNEYVNNLASKYNSTETKDTFMTSYGYEISIPSTTYGWVLNQQATADSIRNALYAHQTQTINPVWAQTASNGSTYVEISLSNQQLFLYKDGQKIDTSTVSKAIGKFWKQTLLLATRPLEEERQMVIIPLKIKQEIPFSAVWIMQAMLTTGCLLTEGSVCMMPHGEAASVARFISMTVPMVVLICS